ncbi:hypothetical protein [Pseudoroseicyclus tamaricis]|uniref:Uncharacterized protein n=1 Tax=Pseudoroseicyclus tamaricis TaxID=2705421 RepID=A0A6B2JVK8_9RHOB|nr:hypothetical protein [Pseudoroseicyclus tamaricis]NDU99421.1 hypothetical protein [Pseudoroseicyclus tamaricis]
MDADLTFVIGVVIGLLSIPSLFGGLMDRRVPIMALVMLVLSAGLIAYAATQNPGAYSIQTVPDAFVRVIGDVIN